MSNDPLLDDTNHSTSAHWTGKERDTQMKKDPLAPAWFHIWFVLSLLLLFVGGIINTVTGGESGEFNPWGAALSMSVMYIIVLVIWKSDFLTRWISRIPLPLIVSSVLLGWQFAEIDELVNFPFNPLVPGISLIGDILLTTPIYIGAHLMWFGVLRRYKFTVFQSLMTGGISLGIFEFVLGAPSPVAILIFPFMVMIHGVHMVIPKLVLGNQLENLALKESKVKYALGIILPAIGAGLGILIASIFGSQ